MRCSQQADMLSICIEDTGCGVPKEKADTIFEEFVQLDDFQDGVGIGLPLSRSIVRRLGGDILLDTTYQSGARFILTLPL
jgi:signal transduction histidine kinase